MTLSASARLFLAAFAVLLIGGCAPARADSVPPNSGLPGATCAAAKSPTPYTAPGAGISVNGLGVDAPAYVEVGRPTGAYSGLAPKGIMLVIHGGGWFYVGKEMVATARPIADRWRARGWMTVNLDYRACSQSIPDVVWFMKRVRAARPTATVCATGVSAGAHLALILASVRSDVACAIAMSGPSDLAALPDQVAFDLTTNGLSNDGPTRLYNSAYAAFGGGPSPFSYRSPIRYAGNVTARLLLASGEHDFLIPAEQNVNYAAAVRAANPDAYVDVDYLAAGDQPFVHDLVSQTALDDFYARELALVAPLVG